MRNLLGELSDINVLRAAWDGYDPAAALTRTPRPHGGRLGW